MTDNRTTERERLNAIRARFGAGPTSMTDEQIEEMSEHYRPKLEADMVIIDDFCPNCGAPKRGDVCDYCGTRFNAERTDVTVIRDWSGDVVHVIERNE